MKSDELRNGGGPAGSAATALGPGKGTAVLPSSGSSGGMAMATGTAGNSGAYAGNSGSQPAAVERDEVAAEQIIDGRYRIIAKLGEGGMGEVYAAEHIHIEKRVAIKLLRHEILAHPEAVTRFRQEARSASSIGHENIIAIEDFGKLEDGRIYLCMELLDGKPLNDLLEEPLQPERVLNILIQTCHGLAAAHRKGIVHRDMKPENIFVTITPTGAEVPKILDFGIAKVQGNDGDNHLTRTGTIFGTPYYMSPEQALGQRVDHRADVYAMGVIMYECFTGSIPFSGDSFMGILTKHITADPTPPSQRAFENGRVLPPGIENVILRAMKKDPEQRHSTMDELVQELVAIHRNLVGPGMSSYMEAHVPVGSAGFSAAGSGMAGMRPGTPVPTPLPSSGMGPAYHPDTSAPLPPQALPSTTPMPYGAAPTGGYVVDNNGRYQSQPFPASSSVGMEPRRSSKVGLIAAIVAVLVVVAGAGGFMMFKDSLAGNGNTNDPQGNGQGNGQTPEDPNGTLHAGTGDKPDQTPEKTPDPTPEKTPDPTPDPTPEKTPDPTPDPDQAAKPVMVLLVSEPSAGMYESDVYVGKTPLNVLIPAGTTKTLVLKRSGYEDATVTLDGSSERHVATLDRKRRNGGGKRPDGDEQNGDNGNTQNPEPGDKPPGKVGGLGLGLE
jgi:serine/threonine protein kinase